MVSLLFFAYVVSPYGYYISVYYSTTIEHEIQ